MFKKVNIFIIVVLCCCIQVIDAQNQLNESQFFCKVLDVNSEMPIFYATIKLSGTNRGVIADDKGEFRLPFNLDISEKIILSSIGYKTKQVEVKQLKANQINIIYLEPNIEDLDAVVLVSKQKKERRLNAKQIVLKALRNISVNYPKESSSYIGYYRDYQEPIGDSYERISRLHKNSSAQYINLNEGIIEVFDAGFGTDYLTNNQNQILIYSYNKNATFIQDKALAIPYDNKSKKYLESVFIPPFGGNEFNVLNITNAIRNHNRPSFSFIEVLDEDFMKNHFFKLEGVSYLDDTPIYELSFVSEVWASGELHFAKGKIFISKENFAIHKLNYQLYGQNRKTPLYRVTIEYVPIGGKMYLNYITFNNKFQAGSEHYFKIKAIKFNVVDMFFDVYFNKKLDKKTIYPIHKKFKVTYTYKEEKIGIKDVLVFDDHIRVVIDKKQLLSLPDFKIDNLSEMIRLKIQKVMDIDGRILNEIPKVTLNQYREIFVQEVFPGKKIKDNMKIMNKYAPLSTSEINPFKDKDKYWVNTPLKKNKGY